MFEGKPQWVRLDDAGAIDWPAQLDALSTDGYTGWISLETHWPTPNPKTLEEAAEKFRCSQICGKELVAMAAAV